MKKTLLLALSALLILGMFVSCGPVSEDPNGEDIDIETPVDEDGKDNKTDDEQNEETLEPIKVGASITPHSEILEVIKDSLAEKGYDLEIIQFTDYVQPNLTLENGEIDANYFQHKPYLEDFNEKQKTNLVSVADIHYEPFGIYPGKLENLSDLKEGDSIAIPNDGTNEARALLLLEAQGLITLKEGVGLTATKIDIVENPLKLNIMEIEAAQLARSLQDVAFAVINGNYAIQADLKVGEDAVATEDKDSIAAETYANVIAVKAGNEKEAKIVALIDALQSDIVKDFITNTYEGAVIPSF